MWTCALEGREGLQMWFGLGFCAPTLDTGYLKMSCCIGWTCSSGPVISFALGFYVIASWGGSFVSYGAWDIHVFCWGKEQYLLTRV